MGRVRTKTVKKSAKVIIERYYPKLTLDFETNKVCVPRIAANGEPTLTFDHRGSAMRLLLSPRSASATRFAPVPRIAKTRPDTCTYRLPATPPT